MRGGTYFIPGFSEVLYSLKNIKAVSFPSETPIVPFLQIPGQVTLFEPSWGDINEPHVSIATRTKRCGTGRVEKKGWSSLKQGVRSFSLQGGIPCTLSSSPCPLVTPSLPALCHRSYGLLQAQACMPIAGCLMWHMAFPGHNALLCG